MTPPRKLPPRPSLDHLKHQARDLQRDARAQARALSLADAYHELANGYGFASWPKLKQHVESLTVEDHGQPRIDDAHFRQAVALIDAGDVDALRVLLTEHPDLLTRRAEEDGSFAGPYFKQPALLSFVAKNPIRGDRRLPENIAAVTQVLIDKLVAVEVEDLNDQLDDTLSLVASGCVPRECGVQAGLIDTLVATGADPAEALWPALNQGELNAVRHLLGHGAEADLPIHAALGEAEAVRAWLPANPDDQHAALMLAAMLGHTAVVQVLLKSGVDPNGRSERVHGGRMTALHQAAVHSHGACARLLVEHGADTGFRDTMFNGTPAEWARHAGHDELADWLDEPERAD